MDRRYSLLLVLFLLAVVVLPSFAMAAWNGSPFSRGATLNPDCTPLQANCSVATSSVASLVVTTDGIGIASSSPATTAQTLYALGNVLYWNGSAVSIFGTEVSSVNGLTATSQTFATSSSGNLTLTIDSSDSTHTFSAGLVAGYSIPLTASTTDWDNTSALVSASSTNWDSAYSWSDHASAGYLTTSAASSAYLTQSVASTSFIEFGTSSVSSITTLPNLALTSANIFVGNAFGKATGVAVSGDITMDATGATTIGASKVTNAMLAGSIADSNLSTISTANKVSGSALQLMTNGGLQNSTGIGVLLNGTSLSVGASGLSINLASQNSWTAAQTFTATTTAEGGITLTNYVPVSTTDTLYNQSGVLYWNGQALGVSGAVITTLNGLSTVDQTFATATSGGLDLHITSSGSTHTFSLGLASDHDVPLSASTTEWANVVTTYLPASSAATTYLSTSTASSTYFRLSDWYATSTVGNITTLPSLTSIGTLTNLTATFATTSYLNVTTLASTSALRTSGNSTFIGAITASSTLNVTGATTLYGTLSAGTSTLSNLIISNTSTSTFAGPISSASGNLIVSPASASGNLLLNPYGGKVGIGVASPSYALDISGVARVPNLIAQNLSIAGSYGSIISASAGVAGMTNFSGGIGTGGATSLGGGSLFSSMRLTNTGNLVNIGSIQAGETLLTRGGTFDEAHRSNLYAGYKPRGVAAGDLNGDGKTDLVAVGDLMFSNLSNAVTVWLNPGVSGDYYLADSSVQYAAGASSTGVTIADFSGDGKADLAVTNTNDNTVSVLLNSGSGTFPTKVDYATGVNPGAIATGDFNGDGKMDLVVANANAGSSFVSIFLNNSNGTFATRVDYPAAQNPYSVAVADFNGDGKVDLVVANYTDSSISLFLNNGDGTFATRVDQATGFPANSLRSVAVGDFNGDGRMDFVAPNSSGDSVSTFIDNGLGGYTKVDYTAGELPNFVAVGDLDGDGKPDLAVTNYNSNTVSVLLNNGNGTFATKTDYGTESIDPFDETVTGNPVAVAIGDFSNDGKVDLAAINFTSDLISAFLNIAQPIFYAQASTGNVGIGTTAPLQKLDVDGSIRVRNGSSLILSDADSSNFIALKSPTNVAANLTYTLPATDGSSGQALSTNGSGALFWADANGEPRGAGVIWRPAASVADIAWRSVASGNNLFVAVADGDTSTTTRVMTSVDGMTWTPQAFQSKSLSSVAYGNGLFVAVSDYCLASNCVATSPDGVNWTIRDIGFVHGSWKSIAYGNGVFVAVSDTASGSNIISSPDGISWTAHDVSVGGVNNSWKSIAYGNGLFVAVADQDNICYPGDNSQACDVVTSSDGATWTIRNIGIAHTSADHWKSVAYGAGTFVAVTATAAGSNRVMTSLDGISWMEVSLSSSQALSDWQSITYGDRLFVAVANTGDVMTSPDGATWTSRTPAAYNVWSGITYGNGVFVAVASSGSGNRVMLSSALSSSPAITATSSSAGYTLRFNGTGIQEATSTIFVANSGLVGIGTKTPTNLLSMGQGGGFYDQSTGAWTNGSDRGYKANILDLTKYGLDTINALRPVSYTVKESGVEQIGFIAQEVKQIVPELVSGEDGAMGLNYGGFTPILVKALQQQQAQILALQANGGAGATPSGDQSFFDDLFTRFSAWFGDATSGIANMFAKKVHVEQLCVKKGDGTELCLTGDQLQNIIGSQSVAPVTSESEPAKAANSPAQSQPAESTSSQPAELTPPAILPASTNTTSEPASVTQATDGPVVPIPEESPVDTASEPVVAQ